MLLCDVGNSRVKFYKGGVTQSMPIAEFMRYEPKERIFFISVNESAEKKLKNPLFVDLTPYFELKTAYRGLGIDRIAACSAVTTGVVVDAGSAITVDMMFDGSHLGGFIMPGISALLKASAGIAPVLDVSLASNIDLDPLPQKTVNAVNYGILKPIVLTIENIAGNNKIYFTGGDGAYLMRYFRNSIYEKDLIFKSMVSLIAKKRLA